MKTVEIPLKNSEQTVHINPAHVAEIREVEIPLPWKNGATEITMSDGTKHVVNNGLERNQERLSGKS